MINLIRPDLLQFKAYSTARDEAKEGKIWLNANESPYQFQQSGVFINRYPEKQPKQLVKRVAEIFTINSEQIAITRGSDEAIDLLIRLFCVAGKDEIMICPPTYGVYSIYANLQNAAIQEVPLLKNNNFNLDLESIEEKWHEMVKLIFLCSPNNPTGNIISKTDILTLCQKYKNKSIIVIDEAYIDFSDSCSLISCINDYDNLVILRTASKAYAMAGLRFGFIISNGNLINWILRIIAPYPLSSLLTSIAVEAFSPSRLSEIKKQINSIKAERDRLYTALQQFSCIIKVWPSEANYLLIETKDSDKIMYESQKKGIVLRNMFDKLGLTNCIRISIGLPEENSAVLKLLEEIG